MSSSRKSDYSIGKSSNFDIRLLNVFVAVVEHGGFTQAQQALNISLSSISTYINDLEIRLGLKLCNRGRGGFSLTQNGQAVYEQAVQLFNAADRFNEQVAGLKGKLSGELVIGILDNSTMSPGARIQEVIHGFAEQHPDVHISIKVLSSDKIEKALISGDVHVGIGLVPETSSALRSLVNFAVTIDLYCGSQHALFDKPDITLDDLASVAYANGSYAPPVKGTLGQMLPVANAFSYMSEGLAFLILSGRYVGYLPRRYAANWVSNGEMRAFPEALFSHELALSLMVQRGQAVSPILAAFLGQFESFDSASHIA